MVARNSVQRLRATFSRLRARNRSYPLESRCTSRSPFRRLRATRQSRSMVSLKAGENPDGKTLRVIEERFCNELGYAEHQRVSVVHHDTDNVHIHVAINKIHPQRWRFTIPFGIIKRGPKLCAILEHELGLAKDSPRPSHHRENRHVALQ